jgi:hypothetical protein
MKKLLKGRQLKAALKEVFGPIKREKWATYGWKDRLIYFNHEYRGIQAWYHERQLFIHFRYKGDFRCYEGLDLILGMGHTDDRLAKVFDKLDKLGIKY